MPSYSAFGFRNTGFPGEKPIRHWATRRFDVGVHLAEAALECRYRRSEIGSTTIGDQRAQSTVYRYYRNHRRKCQNEPAGLMSTSRAQLDRGGAPDEHES